MIATYGWWQLLSHSSLMYVDEGHNWDIHNCYPWKKSKPQREHGNSLREYWYQNVYHILFLEQKEATHDNVPLKVLQGTLVKWPNYKSLYLIILHPEASFKIHSKLKTGHWQFHGCTARNKTIKPRSWFGKGAGTKLPQKELYWERILRRGD